MTEYSKEVRNVKRLAWVLAFLTAALIVVLILYVWPIVRNRFWPSDGMRQITPRGELMDFEKTTIAICKKASPSVVFITSDTQRINPFNRRAMDVPLGSGSGFVWDESGHIVTNNHVIQNPSGGTVRLHVILNDYSSYDAEVVGASPDHDLAVLKINVPAGVTLVPIPIGTSNDLQVGQSVFAIGNPFGLDQSVSTGIISALKRTINANNGVPIEDVVQTDAAINPGNSGGPLLDSYARLIGVNTAILSAQGDGRGNGQWQGIGFAIPVDTANRVVPQIIQKGKYSRARLGIRFNDEVATHLMETQNIKGAAISELMPNSPAEKAGLKGITLFRRRPPELGDVITKINSQAIKSSSDLFFAMDHIEPGSVVEVTIWRNGESRVVNITTTSDD